VEYITYCTSNDFVYWKQIKLGILAVCDVTPHHWLSWSQHPKKHVTFIFKDPKTSNNGNSSWTLNPSR
jgi:hypothetical protein